MIHYSCDRCGCQMRQRDSLRYVVKMEMEATLNIEDEANELDNDQDCLLEMDQLLENVHKHASDEDEPVIHQRKTFDLCPSCFRKFVRNPVGKERVSPFGFSHN